MGAEYSFAFAGDGNLYEACGVKGIPHAALVSPDGEILWTGSPYSLSSGKVKDALKGASKSITFGWGKDYKDVAANVIDGKFGKAIASVEKRAAKGDENAEAIKASVLSKLGRRVESMNKAHKEGDFLGSLTIAEELDGNLTGLDQAATVSALIETIESDADAKPILEGQRKLAKLVNGKLDKTKQMQSAIKKAGQVAGKYPGTIVEKQAQKFIKSLEGRMRAKKGI